MRPVLLHAHIFKNAGTSLDWALQRHFGSAFLNNEDEQAMRQEGAGYLEGLLRRRGELVALSSHHMPAGVPKSADWQVHPLYLLRHPLHRVLSLYTFERQQDADTPGARAAKVMGLPEYVAWRLRPDVPNVLRSYQSAYLAGCHEPLVSETAMARHFQTAQQALEQLQLVGLVERFDESMVLFESLLEPVFPGIDLAYRPQNQSPKPETARNSDLLSLLAALGEEAAPLLETNAYDLALYRLAGAKLDSALSLIENFEDKLREFRIRCNVI